MFGLNRLMVVGTLPRDPEIRSTTNGTRVANFTIGITDTWRDKTSGERKTHTEWVRCVVWGPLVDVVEKYVFKNSRLFLSGKIQTKEWEKNGAKASTTELVLQGFSAELILLDAKPDSKSRQDSTPSLPLERPSQPSPRQAPRGDLNDDIPF